MMTLILIILMELHTTAVAPLPNRFPVQPVVVVQRTAGSSCSGGGWVEIEAGTI